MVGVAPGKAGSSGNPVNVRSRGDENNTADRNQSYEFAALDRQLQNSGTGFALPESYVSPYVKRLSIIAPMNKAR